MTLHTRAMELQRHQETTIVDVEIVHMTRRGPVRLTCGSCSVVARGHYQNPDRVRGEPVDTTGTSFPLPASRPLRTQMGGSRRVYSAGDRGAIQQPRSGVGLNE